MPTAGTMVRCEGCGQNRDTAKRHNDLNVMLCDRCTTMYSEVGLIMDDWFSEEGESITVTETIERSKKGMYRIDAFVSGFETVQLNKKYVYNSVRVFRYFRDHSELVSWREYLAWDSENGLGFENVKISDNLRQTIDRLIEYADCGVKFEKSYATR